MYFAEGKEPELKATNYLITFMSHSGKGRTVGTKHRLVVARKLSWRDRLTTYGTQGKY